jgi:spore germination protein KC
MKKVVLFLLLCLNLFFLTGCWDRAELEDITIMTGIGLDMNEENQIEVTVNFYVPKVISGEAGGGRGGAATGEALIRTGVGDTIADAIGNVKLKIPRRIFWGHTKILVINERVAKEGIREPLDFIVRHYEPRLRTHVFVSKDKAKDILTLLPPLEDNIMEVLRELAESKVMKETLLKDLLLMLTGKEGAAALPMIDILPPMKGNEEPQSIAYINRTAIFKEDKMIGSIDEKLTRGVVWILDEVVEATITTVTPAEAKKGHVSVAIFHAKTELLPKIKDGKWEMIVKATAEGDAVLNGTNLNLMNLDISKSIEKEIEEEIIERLEITLQKVQKEMKADVFGFAGAFYRKYPEKLPDIKDHWDDIFPQVDVKIEVEMTLRRPGISTTPQGWPEEEVEG